MSARKRKSASNVRTLPNTTEAEIAVARMRALENDGTFTPSGVLEDARNPASPLHSFFTWEDNIAAEQFRLQQARELIARFKVEIRTTTRTVSAVIYCRDPRSKSDEQGMVSITRCLSDADLSREVAVQEIDRALALLRRANDQIAALGYGDVLRTVIVDAEGVRDRIAVSGDKGSRAA